MTNNYLERFENEKYRLSVYAEEWLEPFNPREINDNFGKMVCFHRNYDLGDKHNYDDSEDFFRILASDLGIDTTYEEYDEDYEAYDEIDRDIEDIVKEVENKVVILPLFLYDHSGLSMRSYRHGYHSMWDCGQVGYIYVTEEDIKKEYGEVTDETKKKALYLLEGEIEEYSKYLEGDIYYYVLEEKKLCEHCGHMEYEDIDSCGGFFGYDLKYILEQVDLVTEELQELVGAEYKIA